MALVVAVVLGLSFLSSCSAAAVTMVTTAVVAVAITTVAVAKQNSIQLKKTAKLSRVAKDSKRMCRISIHPFHFVAYRNKQDIWATQTSLVRRT